MSSLLLNRCALPETAFDDFVRQLNRGEFAQTFSIPTDIIEGAKEYRLTLDLPGFDKDKIDIDFKEGVLSVSASRTGNKDVQVEKDQIHLSERRYGEFKRLFAIKNVSDEQITADYKNGVLMITLPKKTEALAKKIIVS